MTRTEFIDIIDEKVFVLDGTSELGKLSAPAKDGKFDFADAFAFYQAEVREMAGSKEKGVIIGEFECIREARAALLAVREISDFPFVCIMDCCTDPLASLITMQSLGADAFGCCCAGNDNLAALKKCATIPLVAKVNPGDDVEALVKVGANILIGECEDIDGLTPVKPEAYAVNALTSASKTVFIGPGHDFAVIGERINPTGKSALQEELKKGCLDLVKEMALEQVAKGAAILDVNVGMPGIDEKEVMVKVVEMLSETVDLPLCIDSANPEVVEAALRVYPGRAMVNSISAETPRIEKLLPVAAKYGAMIIALPMTDDGIPETIEARWNAVQKIANAAAGYGYENKDICVDGLLLAVCTSSTSGSVSLETIRRATEAGFATVCGLSNISFGMPERPLLNSTFLAMAIGNGLSTAIANPSSEVIMKTIAAAEALNGNDADTLRYIMKVTGM